MILTCNCQDVIVYKSDRDDCGRDCIVIFYLDVCRRLTRCSATWRGVLLSRMRGRTLSRTCGRALR